MLGEDGEDEGVQVVEDGGGGARGAAVGGGVDATAPAALVEGVDLDVVSGGEVGEEEVVGVAVVAGGR